MSLRSLTTIIFALTLPLAVGANEPVALPRENVHAKGTKILPGTAPDFQDERTHFTIDISRTGFFEKINIAGARRLAVIFSNASDNAEQTCPFFDLKSRHYKIIETSKNVFRIEAEATEQEYKDVTESGCVIVTPPDRTKIEPLHRPRTAHTLS